MKTITINSKHHQECDVVMLPTDVKNHTPLGFQTHGSGKDLLVGKKVPAGSGQGNSFNPYFPQHLYILSDEEIKEGDYYIHSGIEHNTKKQYHTLNQCYKPLRQVDLKWLVDGMYASNCKKVIATTDSSLWLNDDTVPYPKTKTLPQIPQQFIEHYIGEYNKNNVINKILVEVNVKYKHYYKTGEIMSSLSEVPDFNSHNMKCERVEKITILKLNQNNEISILTEQEKITYTEAAKNEERIFNASMMNKKQETVEEAAKNTTNKYINEREKQTAYLEFIEGVKWQAERNYSREEVIELIESALFDASDLINNFPDGTTSTINREGYFGFNKWIEENLK